MNAPRSLQIPLWIIAVILLIQGLRVTWLVTLPVALALFIVALAWPLQQMLERRLRQGLAVAVTSAVIFAVFAVAIGVLALCVDSIVAVAPDYAERLQALSRQAMAAAEGVGLSLDGEGSRQRALEQLAGVAQVLALNLYEAITILSLATIFIVLTLLEVHSYRDKLEARQTQTSQRLLAASSRWLRHLPVHLGDRTGPAAGVGHALLSAQLHPEHRLDDRRHPAHAAGPALTRSLAAVPAHGVWPWRRGIPDRQLP